jgi:hypothetical protein
MSDYGCSFETHKTQKWNRKTRQYENVAVHCMKLTGVDSAYCPKHDLIVQDASLEPQRKAERRRLDKEYKEAQWAVLAASPLACLQPEKDKLNGLDFSK